MCTNHYDLSLARSRDHQREERLDRGHLSLCLMHHATEIMTINIKKHLPDRLTIMGDPELVGLLRGLLYLLIPAMLEILVQVSCPAELLAQASAGLD